MSVQGRLLAIVTALIIAAVPSGRAASQELPHAFPREGAIQVLDNAWGTAWDVTWTPHRRTAMHRHAFDYVGVELADSSVALIAPDGQTRTVTLKRGASYFAPKGTTHAEEGLTSDPPRHAVLIDLKEARAPLVENSTSYPTFPGNAAKKIVENERVVMWDYTWPSAAQGPLTSFYARNAFIVFIDRGELASRDVAGFATPDKTVAAPGSNPIAPGQVLFRPAGHTWTEHTSSPGVRAMVVELK